MSASRARWPAVDSPLSSEGLGRARGAAGARMPTALRRRRQLEANDAGHDEAETE